MGKANKNTLADLHGMVAETILERLRDKENCTAADIKNAMQFLKDNGIQSDPDNPTDTEKSILDELPTFDENPSFVAPQ